MDQAQLQVVVDDDDDQLRMMMEKMSPLQKSHIPMRITHLKFQKQRMMLKSQKKKKRKTQQHQEHHHGTHELVLSSGLAPF